MKNKIKGEKRGMKICNVKEEFMFDETKHNTEGMISASQIITYLKCNKAWEYSYIQGLKPRIERPYLTIGKLCHVGMEAAMRRMWENTYPSQYGMGDPMDTGHSAMEKAFDEYMTKYVFLDEEMEALNQLLYDSLIIFSRAWTRFEPERFSVVECFSLDNREKIPMLEFHFVVPCTGSKGLHGFIDAVLMERETGQIYFVDYKFRKTLTDDTEEQLNIQNAIYTYVGNKMKMGQVGTITWQHLNTAPSMPSVNKNGTLSRAKIKTDWDMYKAMCIVHGQNPDEYEEEMVEKLAEIEWCRETREYRNEITIKNIWKKIIIPTAYSIRSKKKRIIAAMFPWNCKMCDFTELCLAELRDHDTEYISVSQFMKKGEKIENEQREEDKQ